MNLTTEQKSQILDKIELYINSRFFNPLADLAAWTKSWPETRGWIQASSTSEEFEERIRQSLDHAPLQPHRLLSRERPRRSSSLRVECDVSQIR